MRRIASELDVQPSALYHHVSNKQSLLAMMADEIVQRVDLSGDDPRDICRALRDAMLAIRDGAEVVATATAYRLGASAVEIRLEQLLGRDAARTLLLFTLGQAQATQTYVQAVALGALEEFEDAPPGTNAHAELDDSFERGLAIVMRGLER